MLWLTLRTGNGQAANSEAEMTLRSWLNGESSNSWSAMSCSAVSSELGDDDCAEGNLAHGLVVDAEAEEVNL